MPNLIVLPLIEVPAVAGVVVVGLRQVAHGLGQVAQKIGTFCLGKPCTQYFKEAKDLVTLAQQLFPQTGELIGPPGVTPTPVPTPTPPAPTSPPFVILGGQSIAR